jgi:hypothetical protein
LFLRNTIFYVNRDEEVEDSTELKGGLLQDIYASMHISRSPQKQFGFKAGAATILAEAVQLLWIIYGPATQFWSIDMKQWWVGK